MGILPLSLLLIAAFFHASWNYLAKESADPFVMLWTAHCMSLLMYGPFFWMWFSPEAISAEGWLFVLATGLLHAVYFFTLGTAYRTGELSIVYPLARGSAPLFAAVIAALTLGERISAQGGAGIAIIVIGIYLTHLTGFGRADWAAPGRRWKEKGVRWALVTGLVIALYSVVDKAGVSRIAPEIYIYLMFALTCLFTAPLALSNGRAKQVCRLLSEKRLLVRVALGGAFTMGSYGLVLYAMKMSMVSYVVAAREVSVIIGAAMGVFILREGGRRQKLWGAALIAAGVMLIAA
ncbi:MAG: DMT family transporter, partial [bacterium]|nr:DMT family transporter [bacterium]